MKEQLKKNLVGPLLPFVLSSLLLVVLLCGLSRATEAEPGISPASQDRARPGSLDYQTGVSVCQQAANRVPHPGFEQGSGNPWKPYDWREVGPCTFSYDDPGPDSDRSARIVGTLSDENCRLRTRTDSIRVEPGRSYDYSAWVEANLVEGDAYLRIQFWSWQDDPPGWRSEGDAYTRHVTDTDDAWVEVSGSVTAPVGAQYARVEATLTGPSAGSVWFDDVFFGLATCLDISKRDDPDPVMCGGMLTYTIVCSNTGREEARNVQIVETYSKYVDFYWAEPPPDRGNHTWVTTCLVPGESRVVTVSVEVEDDTEGNILLFNEVDAFSEETVDNPISRRISTRVVCQDGPRCKIDLYPLDADKAGEPGYSTDYDVVLTNAGSCEGEARVMASSSRDWPVTVKPHEQPYTLPSGGSVTVTVSLSVPEHSPAGTVDDALVTATLTCGSPCNEMVVATATLTTTVGVPLTKVDIDGLTIGAVNTAYTFAATVSPPSATQPIDYIWHPTPDEGQGSALVTYTWSATGTKTITVTAMNAGGTATDIHSISIERHKVYLPLVLCCWPLIPPELHTIENGDIDGSYDVCWSDVACRADFYVLEEATDDTFADATEACSPADTCCPISGRGAGRYYYRVKACNSFGCSGWSNVEEVGAWWEHEDEWGEGEDDDFNDYNDSCSKANGPLIFGEYYYGYPDDKYDCFKIHPDRKGQVTMKLENHTGTCVNLILYYQSEANPVCRVIREPYEKTCDVKSGTYCICIRTDQGHNRDTPYRLRATFP
jgi:uncharacterized repeat protein (TIGR01451 family)